MYPTFTPPADIPGDPAKLTPNQAIRFFDWFKKSIAERIDVLAAEVRKTPEGVNWKPDFSPQSLTVLGAWLFATATAVKSEVAIVPGEPPKVLGGTHKLTGETLGRCFDAGVYLGEVLRHENPTLRWDIENKAKSNINYGLPIIRHKDETCSPIRLVVVSANKIIMKTADANQLYKLWEVWSPKLAK